MENRNFRVLLIALLLLSVSSCQPHVLASSLSPEGKYRCEVYQGSPDFLWGLYSEKFRYYFNVIQLNPYSSLKQKPDFEYQSDIQLHEGDFQFKWSGREVEVTIVRNGNVFARMIGNFDEREQRWLQVKQ
jgi:hypothetical protein